MEILSTESLLFLFLLFIIAALYASVGHGGASGYLALMGIFHFAPEEMRPTALLLNIFVSFVAWFQYSRNTVFNRKLFLWLIAGSLPAAFAGGMITLDAALYKQILGGLLFLPALRLFGVIKNEVHEIKEPAFIPAFLIGIAIGLISGIIGIGGGIILSPVLLLLKWTNIKETALISALFIFLNSLSGLAGLFIKGIFFQTSSILWIGVALTGGLIGAWYGSSRISPQNLRYLLGVVLVIAGTKLMFF